MTTDMARWVSPNDMLEAGKRIMLDGNDPQTQDDWVVIVNFMAYNIDPVAALPTMKIIKMLYDIPLSDEYIDNIVEYQIKSKSN